MIHNIWNDIQFKWRFPKFNFWGTKFKYYAKITSCDVEQSFSKYKNILLKFNRKSFTYENLKHHVIHLNGFHNNCRTILFKF